MKLNNLTEEIKRSFAGKYLKWGLLLEDSVINSASTHVIRKENFEIRFVENEDNEGKYLEFYAISSEHADEHYRIYDDGSIKSCDTILEGYSYDESLPGSKEIQREAYIENNRKVYDYLKETGLYRR